MRTTDERTSPADEGPVERRVRPVSWRREWNGDVSDLGTYVHADSEDELDAEREWQPLYDQATLDAAVAAERERCAKIVEEASTKGWGHIENATDLRDALAAAIRDAERDA